MRREVLRYILYGAIGFGLAGTLSGLVAIQQISGHFVRTDLFAEGFVFGCVGTFFLCFLVRIRILKKIILITLTGGVGFGLGYVLMPWISIYVMMTGYINPLLALFSQFFVLFVPFFCAGAIYMVFPMIFLKIKSPLKIVLWSGFAFSSANIASILILISTSIPQLDFIIFLKTLYGVIGGVIFMMGFYFFEKFKNVNSLDI